MRPTLLALSAIPLALALSACENSQQPANTANPPAAPAAATPAAPAPAAPTPAPAPQSTAAADLEPLVGTWATGPEACGTPITIAADSFKGYENSCQITGWTNNGDGTFTAAVSCASEGQTAAEKITMTPLFGPQGEGIRLAYDDRGGDPVTVFRCPTPRAAQ